MRPLLERCRPDLLRALRRLPVRPEISLKAYSRLAAPARRSVAWRAGKTRFCGPYQSRARRCGYQLENRPRRPRQAADSAFLIGNEDLAGHDVECLIDRVI